MPLWTTFILRCPPPRRAPKNKCGSKPPPEVFFQTLYGTKSGTSQPVSRICHVPWFITSIEWAREALSFTFFWGKLIPNALGLRQTPKPYINVLITAKTSSSQIMWRHNDRSLTSQFCWRVDVKGCGDTSHSWALSCHNLQPATGDVACDLARFSRQSLSSQTNNSVQSLVLLLQIQVCLDSLKSHVTENVS